MLNYLLVNSATYSDTKYLSAGSARHCAGGGGQWQIKQHSSSSSAVDISCGRRQESHDNHMITTGKRAAKNKCRGYESK